MLKLLSYSILLTMVVATPLSALAQLTAPGGQGLVLGSKSRLHFFGAADNRWSTNPGRIYKDTTSDLVTSGRVGLAYVLPGEMIDLNSTASVEFQRFWGIENKDTRLLSNIQGGGALGFNFNKTGPVSVRFSQSGTRSADPANQSFTQRLLHFTTSSDLFVDIRPGGGNITGTVGYSFVYDRYDRDNPGVPNPAALDNMRHVPMARLSWRFLPKTSLFGEARGGYTQYNSTATFGTTGITNQDTFNLAVQGGLTGNLTTRVTMTLSGGYGQTFTETKDNFASWVGTADVSYRLGELSKLSVGFSRSAQPTSLYKYYSIYRTYTAMSLTLPQSFLLSLGLEYGRIDFGKPLVDADAGPTRKDDNYLANVSIFYVVREWLAVGIIEKLDYRMSNSTGFATKAGYFNNDFLFRVDFRY